MSKKKALGRGLNALLSDSNIEERLEVDIPNFFTVHSALLLREERWKFPLEHIEVNPFQPRSHFDQEVTKRTCRVN
jgi:ParB family chromosome partitioning protein